MARFIPSRLVVASAIIALLFSHFVSSHGSAAAAQNEPTQQIPGMPVINHDPVECVIENKHPLFQASVQAQGGLHTVKIYFHAKDYNDFYYVEMARGGRRLAGVTSDCGAGNARVPLLHRGGGPLVQHVPHRGVYDQGHRRERM